ncbi:MAG TPA: helix-turn-helix transcriptional regulator [Thermoleophilaceae bacterium]|nr:helix-turn-helix transcriptional regulator [Thermoleophilaceae bacterium]
MVNLLAERKNRGLSQQEMADKIGVTRRVWAGAETGESEPRGRNARKIADFLELQVTDIWSADDEPAAEAVA